MTRRKANLITVLSLLLFLLQPLAKGSYAQFFNEPAEPLIPEIEKPVSEVASRSEDRIPEPVRGDGKLSISIESFKGGNPKRISLLADRVEVWLGDHRLASLNYTDPEVVKEQNRRIFLFPELNLANGYYFITVRLYSSSAFYGRDKWHGETFQVGIHPGRTARVYRKVAFFHF